MTDTRPTPADVAKRMASAYDGLDPHEQIRARVGWSWRPDPESERLLSWRTEDPARWAALSPGTRLALGYYVEGRNASLTAEPNR